MSASISTYDLAVPILVRNLELLNNIIDKAIKHAEDIGKDPESFLEAHIIDDMLPLSFQFQTCNRTAQGMLPLITTSATEADKENKDNIEEPKTLVEHKTRINYTISLLRSLKKEDFVEASTETRLPVPPSYQAAFPGASKGYVKFTALSYLQKYILPTFFFHMVTAYDILRKEGVPVGKFDFLGAQDFEAWEM
ncbi:hypothetical protein CKM354_001199100 [Cercospora kikuchii]|uniref:DUF1993 domain-containing protein n=1 Tax=Cercospora kikuchii TaxID=84275 RepID=A0A9P3FIL3_9PEZI|nr:uncharacterized protein CKM354_001199100 [Cercospora kikuchii]GIZ48948.1 hypothetical protein CKM354_001199100 [Cercospora kikuchii]